MDKYSDHIVRILRLKMPGAKNFAQPIMDVLGIGKESAYRRLRGDIPFTLAETVKLAEHFNFSIDSVLGHKFSDGILFNACDNGIDDIFKRHESKLKYFADLFADAALDPDSVYMAAVGIVNLCGVPNYPVLNRYALLRRAYQVSATEIPLTMNQIEVPEGIMKAHEELFRNRNSIGKITYIWDRKIFAALINEIKYFLNLHILTENDRAALKAELSSLIVDLENVTNRGGYDRNNTSIYLSNLNLENSGGYIKCNNVEAAFLRLRYMETIESRTSELCAMQLEWLKSTIRHSTLITESGEIERIGFFKKQKELLDTL